jgi:hypothetical protein
MNEKFCKHCGRRFEPRNRLQLFCCEECERRANNIKHNELRKENTRRMQFKPQLCAEINERTFDVKYDNDSYVHRADFYLGF